MSGDVVTLGDLQAQVQERADVANATTAYPLSYITELINKGWRRLYGILTETGEDYYTTSVTFTAVANASTYFTEDNESAPAGTNVLPTNMYKVRGVDAAAVVASQYNPLERAGFEQRCDNTSLGGWPWPWPMPKYQYIGSGSNASLLFTPAPQASIAMRLWYFPVPPTLANANTDTIDAANGWDIYVVDWAARRCAEKDENYELCGRLDASINEIEMQIRREAANRNAGQAYKVVRRRRRHGWGGGSGYGGLPGF